MPPAGLGVITSRAGLVTNVTLTVAVRDADLTCAAAECAVRNANRNGILTGTLPPPVLQRPEGFLSWILHSILPERPPSRGPRTEVL